MIKEAIELLTAGKNLTESQSENIMEAIMEGQATPAQIAALLVSLRFKGETVEEITGFVKVMRKKATRINTKYPVVVDTCGTGGDGANTFNISTTAAFVIAGAGAPVAKHGNRSVSSRCGSADLLEALNVRIDLEPGQVESCLEETGIAFLFAPLLHSAMKHVAVPRREIGIRTVFNVLGPMTNPAGAKAQVMGVYDRELTTKLGGVLARLGTEHSFIICGDQGIDEISLSGPAYVCEIKNGKISEYTVDPEKYGLPRSPAEELFGGSPSENAAHTLSILNGEPGPRRNSVLINAAFGIVASGLAEDLSKGLDLAAESISSGAALEKLQRLIRFTNSVKEQVSSQ
ncbi:MAG TPA: anthranilate phosphoribosyltransferase [Desulfotomaculum sp.]|nr:anthranilate phosphoribosyltransferase [Desulfotomaculum sp.]